MRNKGFYNYLCIYVIKFYITNNNTKITKQTK